eukprot:219533_1
MSTSIIMRPISNHNPSSTTASTSSSHSESPRNHHQEHKHSHKRSKSDNYTQKRNEFINRIYNHNSNTNKNKESISKTQLLSPSSTDNAESESFILDSNSPLFGGSFNEKYNDKNDKKQFEKMSNNKFMNKSFSEPIHSNINKQNNEMKNDNIIPMPQLQRRQTNIHQNINITPPKKMRQKATKDELQLVLNHFKIAKNKDIESILRKHEPHVLYYRDKLYNEAKQSGINAQSNDYMRLKILGAVVEFTYMNIEPPNEYTKQTDRKHFKEVGAWTAKFAKNKGIKPPVTLIYSAWCHDIERFIPSTKCEYLPESVDKYRKQIIHGITSAKVAICLLKGAPVTDAEKERIYQMVLYHDIPHPQEDIVILNETLITAAPDGLMEELRLLMDADSFAFFQSTIYFFILFKSKKNSPDWIWERVRNNIKRLRPYLREKAVKCINKLPKHLLNKMSINYNELKHLCSESGINTIAQSNINSRTTTNSPSMDIIKKNQKYYECENIIIVNHMKKNEIKNTNSDSKSQDLHLNDM